MALAFAFMSCSTTKKNSSTVPDLSGVWEMESINGKATKSDRRQPEISFNADELKISGSDGCNQIFGAIETLEADQISFGRIGGTKRGCPNFELDKRFRAAMGQTSQYQIKKSKLIFLDSTGKQVLTFIAK